MSGQQHKQLRVLITGTTGMVGKGVMYHCFDDNRIASVLVINRHPLGIRHPKLKEIIHQNFSDLSSIENQLSDVDACFFCLGVSAFRMKEEDYHRITYDLTMHVAQTLLRLNPSMSFCYVSGQGTQSSERGSMWARIKGKTENKLLSMPFAASFMFRPGFIQPTRNIRSRTRSYNAVYLVLKPLFPILKWLMPDSITTTDTIGKAMVNAIVRGYYKKILEPVDINTLAAG
jgi:hypothetical protein